MQILRPQKKEGRGKGGAMSAGSGSHRSEFFRLCSIASLTYREVVCKGMLFSFFERYVKIDCDYSDQLQGDELKRHRKAYADLMYLLNQRRQLVEQYFCDDLTDEAFDNLCCDLYMVPAPTAVLPKKKEVPSTGTFRTPLPYTFNSRFSEEQIHILYVCIVGHEILEDVLEYDVAAFFAGTLDHYVQCKKPSRFGYLLRELAINGFITNQYQAAVARCAYILSPRTKAPLDQKGMEAAVSNAGGYAQKDDKIWKRTINDCIEELRLLQSQE